MAAGKSSAGDGPADTPVTLDDVEAARGRLRGAIVETDCDFSRTLSEILGCSVWLKFENLQFTASFKERGALNRLSALSADERKRGVIAMSAGNHAQGVAYHASRLSIPSTIVMPVSTPTVKVVNTRRHGAEIILHGETVEAAASFARQYGRERNLTLYQLSYAPTANASGRNYTINLPRAARLTWWSPATSIRTPPSFKRPLQNLNCRLKSLEFSGREKVEILCQVLDALAASFVQ